MSLAPASKPGQLYLGGIQTAGREVFPTDPVYYDSKDLVTHGVCIGMTGSGKTGLCVSLLEECALSGVPALIIDPKGDLANLALLFPDLLPADFRPWINEDEAGRKGVTPDALAAEQAAAWEKGLAQWGITKDHLQAYRDRVDVRIFTPGSTAGSPLSILHSFDPPGAAILQDDELRREQAAAAVSALLGLLPGAKHDFQSREHILLATILDKRWIEGESTDLATLLHLIQSPPFATLGVLPLESFFPAKDRNQLALNLNTLLASPTFQSWLTGEPLTIDTLLQAPDGRPRLSVCYLAHLNDAERMFFISLLLNQTLAWMRAQSGTSGLRALLYFDEIFGYLPPHPKDPPSKRLLMTLLKQGRAFGLGTMLVTQNPVDLDYKALSNCGTWLIGKLQTDQDKDRILDGLQGAIDSSGKSMDRAAFDRILSGLGKRVFLLHNVHESAPTVFQSRWAMSYLAGPLTRTQLKQIATRTPTPSSPSAPGSLNDFISQKPEATSTIVPPAPAGLTVRFRGAPGAVLSARIFARAEILFKDTRGGDTTTTKWLLELPSNASPLDWEQSMVTDPANPPAEKPPADARFTPLPPVCQDVPALKKLGASLDEYLVKTGALEAFTCTGLKAKSRLGDSREEFETRLRQIAPQMLEAESTKLRDAAEKKISTLRIRLEKEQSELERDKERAGDRKKEEAVSALSNIAGGIFSMLAGRRSTGVRQIGSALKTATGKRGMSNRAALEAEKTAQNVSILESQIAEIESALQSDLAALKEKIDAASAIETTRILPLKTGIQSKEFGILWSDT